MKTRKVNFRTADMSMNDRVSEFATVKLSKITSETRHRAEIKSFDETIKGLNNYLGSADKDKDSVLASIANAEARKAECEQKYQEARKKRARFVYTAEDLDLFGAYEEGEDMTDAFIAWADAWKLDLRNTGLLKDLVKAVSGKQGAASARTMVNSEFGTMTKDRNKTNFFAIVYGIMTEQCVAKGLKMDIPDDIRMAYAPKQKKADK